MPFLAPIIAAISVALAPVITFVTTNFVGRLLVSVAASALMQALAPKPQKQGAGISTSVTQTGGLNPASFILGKYATAGTHICPAMSFGTGNGSPLAYLTYVIDLGDIPGQTLDRVIINDQYLLFHFVGLLVQRFIKGDYGVDYLLILVLQPVSLLFLSIPNIRSGRSGHQN